MNRKARRQAERSGSYQAAHSLASVKWVQACRILDAERKKLTVKGGKKLTESEEEDLAAAVAEGMSSAASLFVNPAAVYKFRLATFYNISSDAAGSVANYWSFDPAQFSEHTAYLKYMFQEVRIVHSRIVVLGVNTSVSAAGIYPSVAIGSTYKYVATTPTSAQTILEEHNSGIRNSAQSYHTRVKEDCTFEVAVPRDYLFASVDSTTPGINQGGWGQWWMYELSQFAASKPAFSLMLECIYEYRART